MTGYILRRLGCSCLIVLGVVFFTFLLFNLAAGDPAAAALGKNAAPREIEDTSGRQYVRADAGGEPSCVLPILF